MNENQEFEIDELTALRLQNLTYKQREIMRESEDLRRQWEENNKELSRMVQNTLERHGLDPSEYQIDPFARKITRQVETKVPVRANGNHA